MKQARFRFAGKEVAGLIIGTALALGSLRSEDPWLVIPMLIISWFAFLYLCAVHEGPIHRRFASALAITILLGAIGIRLFWPSVREGYQELSSWLAGPHGRWFDRMTGALALAFLAVFWRWLKGTARLARMRRLARIDGLPKGFMDYKLDVEQALTAMPLILAKLGAVVGEVGPMLESRAADLQRAASTAAQAKIFAATSLSLDRYSSRVEGIRAKFVQAGSMLSGGLTGWFKWIESARPSRAALGSFPEAISEFRGTIQRSNDRSSAYIDVLSRTKGASRVLDTALDRHIRLMEEILKTNIAIYDACEEALRVVGGLR